jgi:DNA-binding MarR family transcriptional regulator
MHGTDRGALAPHIERPGMQKAKLQISANEVLKDLRNGLSDEGFMAKYNLTYRQLQRLFRKMIQAGFVSPIELAERLCVTESQITEAFQEMEKAVQELD